MDLFNKISDWFEDINPEHPIIAWWSGGVTSAVACKLCIDWFGSECVDIVFIDTKNEDDDTYRFKEDCEEWYCKPIKTISNEKYTDISQVWDRFLTLNTATGAICSSELKREVREAYQSVTPFSYSAFGYDLSEPHRPRAMKLNHKDSRLIFPLFIEVLTKEDCTRILKKEGIKIPNMYLSGFKNNNCFKTGCIQGGIGYWQKMRDEYPEKFNKMAEKEHELSHKKGKPVTILKDQSKGGGLMFLRHNPEFPNVKDISCKKQMRVKPLFECNGFCGTNDFKRNPTEKEINFEI